MKRFFCTICNKVRRTRRLPDDVAPIITNGRVEGYGQGTCRWHTESTGQTTRAQSMDRVRIVAGLGSTRKTSASSAKSKSKK